MGKILSQSGVSLSDLYDIQGSLVGVGQLNSDEIHLVHEMGATLFSERAVSTIRRMTTGDINQNIDFSIQIDDLPVVPFRILGVDVITDNGGRVNHAVVSLHQPAEGTFGQDIPLWTFDQNDAVTGRTVRIVDDGNAEANLRQLAGQAGMGTLPGMGFGTDQRVHVPNIVFRGNTNGFGAGTVEVIALIQVASAESGSGLSSYGLPIPGW